MRKILLSLAMAGLSGCTSVYGVQRLSAAAAPLDPLKTIYVSIPADGKYGNRTAPGSGQQAARSLVTALAARSIPVQLGNRTENAESALASARAAHVAYAALPSLADWERRLNAWSGRPSNASMRVDVFDVASGQRLDAAVLNGRNVAMTFMPTDPSLLLKDTIDDYVQALYGLAPD